MGYVAKIVIITILIYMLCGVLAFIFFFFGLGETVLFLPLDLIDSYIYPVGILPKITIFGGVTFIIAMLLLRIVGKHL